MTSRAVGALIFDLDGLLVDSEPLAAQAMVRFLNSFGIQQDPLLQVQLLGRRLPEAIAICQIGYSLPGTLEVLTAQYGQIRLEALRGAVTAMPGAHEIIALGKDLGLPLALATSAMREHADCSLAETGLAGVFDAEATGEEVLHGKPAPDLFLLAAERMGAPAGSAVVFEDSPLGVEAAVAAGMRVVAVEGGRAEIPAFSVQPTVQLWSLIHAMEWLKAQKIEPAWRIGGTTP